MESIYMKWKYIVSEICYLRGKFYYLKNLSFYINENFLD